MTITLNSQSFKEILEMFCEEMIIRALKDYQGIPISGTDRTALWLNREDAKRWFENRETQVGGSRWAIRYSNWNPNRVFEVMKMIDNNEIDLRKVKNRHPKSKNPYKKK